MICTVILTRENNQYVAKIKEWPDVVVKESSRDKAIAGVKAQLVEYLENKVELIKIEFPVEIDTGNPWLDKFGWFKDDPTFDDLEAEMAAYRREIGQ